MDIYSIGHTNHTIDNFILMLIKQNINCIVDVRSTPFSKYTPQFNKEILRESLNIKGIHYLHMGKEFGARRENTLLYTKEGYLDFQKARNDNDFLSGVERLKDGCEKEFKIALMCTEKDPFDCHRAIMVSKGLKDNGFNVKHILSDNTIQTQEKIEERLLDKYYPDRFQISFFAYWGEKNTIEEMIEEAYKRRNAEIGYRIEGEGND